MSALQATAPKILAPKILAIVPCFNEAQSVARVIDDLKKCAQELDVLVIDDGSSDRTFDVASQTARCVRLPINLGIGGAVQTGIRYALHEGYHFVIQVDGDGQHPATEIAKLVEAATHQPSPSSQIVVGSRFLGESDFRSSSLRRVGIRVISLALSWLFRQKVTDPTSGFRLLDRKAIELFANEYPKDFPEPVSLALALENGIRVTEVSVRMLAREAGRSSIGGLKSLSYMIRVIGYLALVRVGRHI